MWTPTPDGVLEGELRAALAHPTASRVEPPKPVACVDGRAGWLWGRLLLPDGSWAGLVTLQSGAFDGAVLTWQSATELRVLG